MATRTKNKQPTQANATSQNQTPQTVGSFVYVCSHLHRSVIFDMPDGSKVKIKGLCELLRGKEHGIIATGGGIYTKVKADAWEHIAKTFKDYQAIKNGLIYAEKSQRDAKAAIKEKTDNLRDGLEPIDPTKTKTTETDTASA